MPAGHPRRPAAPQPFGGLPAFLVGLFSGLTLAAFGLAISGQLLPDDDWVRYRRVRRLVDETFVRPVTHQELLDDALTGLLEGLDPYSRYYAAEDLPQLDRETSGKYQGIGVLFAQTGQRGHVLFTLPRSPARIAGIETGDRIARIDGIPVEEIEGDNWMAALTEPEDATHELSIEALDGAERTVTFKPARLIDPTVRHTRIVDPARGIGYVAIRSFSRETPGEFDVAMTWLTEHGARALVLDLRDNPGGILDAAVDVARRFVPEGEIVRTTSREGVRSENAEPDLALHAGMPLVVLVDSGSASASEVLAGALQDHRAGVVVGTPTYGKGTVQSVVRFEGQDERVKLTTAFYATPSGRILEKSLVSDGAAGIPPDLLVPIPDETRYAVRSFLDRYGPPPEQRAAIEAWEQEIGRELLPRAPADPQLDAALGLFRGELTREPGGESS